MIDFHTHIFPDALAGSTIKKLEQAGGMKAFTDGTLSGLKKSMAESQIRRSIVLPVVTKPAQFETVNSYAAQINGRDGMISFGGIHPDTEDFQKKLQKIKALGLPGIKLHPDYQKTYVDDPKMVNIIRAAAELGLIVIIHAGIDVGLPDPVHCTPKRAADMLSRLGNPEVKIILAHTGGYGMWDEVEEFIVGKQVWLDASYSMGKIPDEQFIRIVRNHGADRILFATDSPWGGQKETLEHFKRLDLTAQELERILDRNACELLGLQYE